MNPIFQQIMGGGPAASFPVPNQAMPTVMGAPIRNPMQMMGMMMQAMQNPAAFAKQNIPDIPNEILNDPNRVLQYIQQTRGISNEQLQQFASQMPMPRF